MLTAALALLLADTPEGALKEFVADWNRGDVAAAARLVDGADPKAKHEKILTLLGTQKTPHVSVSSIRRRGNQLIVNVDITVPGQSDRVKVTDDTITVVQRPDGWKLVVLEEAKDKAVIGSLAGLLKSDTELPARSSAQKTVAMSNMKQIALGTLMYSQDNNEVLKMSPGTASERIYPYIKNKEVFTDPGTGRSDAYVFNTRLTNVPFQYIKSPADTVMWSLGPQGGLLFPYDGKTVIAFADGHVKTMGKTEATHLRWTPDI